MQNSMRTDAEKRDKTVCAPEQRPVLLRRKETAPGTGPKILIISSDTGGGHRSAAAAIVAGVQRFFRSDSYAVRVVRAIEEAHSLTARLVQL